VEWILGLLSSLFLFLSLSNLYRKYFIITRYAPQISNTFPNLPFSIILCTEGNATHLISYIRKNLSQTYSVFEVIIVCKNTPPEILEELHKIALENEKLRIENISILDLAYTEKKQALNFGISLAKYEWIVSIDDDCYPSSEDWLTSISQHIQHFKSDILLGLSPYISQNGLFNQWIRFDSFITTISYLYFSIIGKPYMGIGRNMAFNKELWTNDYLEKYQNLGSGDDTTLVNYYRISKKIDVFIHPLVFSFPQISFIAWVKQKLRHIDKGHFMDKSIKIELAKTLLFNFLFWLFIWLWLSFFAFHFLIFGLILIFVLFKTFFYFKISKHIEWKSKPILYTFLFDTFHSFCLMIFPILTIFIKIKWRNSNKN
jgi:glycosyltransferase involved in cell wall biosynthesis